MKKLQVAIVGATGAVGAEFLKILAQRKFPISRLSLLASANSAGKKLLFNGQELTLQTLSHDSFTGIDLAFFSAGAARSLSYAPSAVKAGALVIDNSSAFRMDEKVPLVVPECNPEDVFQHAGIIANPNCSTIQMAVALKPLHDFSPLTKIIVATYQAVSGSGAKAVEELDTQTRQYINNQPLTSQVYPMPIFGNVIPHVDIFLDDGYTKEEWKMAAETKKILHKDDIAISATCVRVPVWRAHSEVIWASFAHKLSKAQALKLWQQAPGIKVSASSDKYDTPRSVSGSDLTYIGRIREVADEDNTLCFWCVADQLRKGAALNAVQIAEAYYRL